MVQNSKEEARKPVPQALTNAQANRLFNKQHSFETIQTELDTAIQQRKQVNQQQSFIGMVSAVSLVPLALLNSANDSPVMEVILGIMGPDPWLTPIGLVQPMAIGSSLLVLAAMGLVSLYALADESHTVHNSGSVDPIARTTIGANSTKPETLPPSMQQRPLFNGFGLHIPSLRKLIAGFVMVGLAGVIGYGGYLRAILAETGQNPWTSAVFASGLAFTEELAVVSASMYLMYQLPVWSLGLRRRWLWMWSAHVPGQSVEYTGVVTAAQSVDKLMRNLDSINAEIASATTKITAVAASDTAQHGDLQALLQAKKQSVTILQAEQSDARTWFNTMFFPALCKIAMQPIPTKQSVAQGFAVLKQWDEATQSRIVTPLKNRKTTSDTQCQAARSRAAEFGNDTLDILASTRIPMHNLDQQVTGLPAQRASILAAMRLSLASPTFAAYPPQSQIASLGRLAKVVITLDGASTIGTSGSDDIPIQDRITNAINDLSTREHASPPDASPIARTIRKFEALHSLYTDAQQRVALVTIPEIMAQESIVATLEMAIADLFAEAEALTAQLQTELDAQRQKLQQRQRDELLAQRPLARARRALASLISSKSDHSNRPKTAHDDTSPACDPVAPLLQLPVQSTTAPGSTGAQP